MKAPDANDIARSEGISELLKAWDSPGAIERTRSGPEAKPITHSTANREEASAQEKHAVSLSDFVAYMPAHKYLFKPSGDLWPAASVTARVAPVLIGCDGKGTAKFMPASAWLDQNAPVEQLTWAPGKPTEIRDTLVAEGGWIERPGCTVFNLYRPPTIARRAGDATLWLKHAHRLFGDDAQHVLQWLAHRVQRPGEKVNHALVLGGAQGVGKDTLLEPIKKAIGPWNFAEVSPQHLLGRFNSFLKSVILRVSEARDLGEFDRFAFYDHMKVYTAAPPDVLRVDEKNIREHSVLNVCGVIITTNHKADGIYLPPDDRRHFVAWSDHTRDDFDEGYWEQLYEWLENGGHEIVAGYLSNLDISLFNPKVPPPKTVAFWEIVDASRIPEDAELSDALDRLQRSPATTLAAIAEQADPAFSQWLTDRRNSRRVPHRLEECGYVAVRNPAAKDGLWVLRGRRQAIYGRSDLALNERIAAALRLAGR